MTTAAEHRYRPYGASRDLFHFRGAEIVLSGPAGTGKSRACLEKMHAMMLATPGARGILLRKTHTSLTSTGLVTFREHVAKEAIASGEVVWFGGSPQEPPQYRYGNGSTITVGGMDKATRIMSSEYDCAYVQEATELTEDDWESITTRLRNGKISFQQLMADCNPDVPQHWLNKRAHEGRCVMWDTRHEDNPRLYREGEWTAEGQAYMSVLDALTGVRKERLRYGRWVAAEGLVYDEWDNVLHVYKRVGHPPDHWTRYWAIDFGYNNPFVCQMWAQDPDGRLYLYREIYATGQLVEDHAKAILKAQHAGDKHREPDPLAIICDHDAEGRATLEKHLGMGTIAAKKDVLDGIEAVKVRLKIQGDGKPRLYLCRDALVERDQSLTGAAKPASTLEEVTGYVWDRSGNKAVKEAPLKLNDHGMDAMRYLISHVDVIGEVGTRWL